MPQDVKVSYHTAELPGGIPALFGYRACALEVVFNQSATADEIAAALGPMYAALTATAALHAVA